MCVVSQDMRLQPRVHHCPDPWGGELLPQRKSRKGNTLLHVSVHAASDELRLTAWWLIEAVKQNGFALEHASDELRADLSSLPTYTHKLTRAHQHTHTHHTSPCCPNTSSTLSLLSPQDCFRCTTCDVAIAKTGSRRHMEDGGRIYCTGCWQSTGSHGGTSNVCSVCGQGVYAGEQFLTALGKKWHDRCFTCTRCRQGLGGSFCDVGGKPYCSHCAASASAGVPPPRGTRSTNQSSGAAGAMRGGGVAPRSSAAGRRGSITARNCAVAGCAQPRGGRGGYCARHSGGGGGGGGGGYGGGYQGAPPPPADTGYGGYGGARGGGGGYQDQAPPPPRYARKGSYDDGALSPYKNDGGRRGGGASYGRGGGGGGGTPSWLA